MPSISGGRLSQGEESKDQYVAWLSGAIDKALPAADAAAAQMIAQPVLEATKMEGIAA